MDGNNYCNDESEDLTLVFDKCKKSYFAVVECNGDLNDDVISHGIDVTQKCKQLVVQESIFSRNEELEDIPTSLLKYLSLDYYLGMILSKSIKMETRLNRLQESLNHLQLFLERMLALKIVHDNEVYLNNNDCDEERKHVNPETKRQQKIERYKKLKSLREQIKSLERVIEISESKRDKNTNGGDMDNEEEIRNVIILTMQFYSFTASDEVSLILQEINMLKHKVESDERMAMAVEKGRGGEMSDTNVNLPLKPGDGPGLLITKITKVNGELHSSREVVRASVFVPRMEGPTMTLEEFAEIELANALERQEREKNSERADSDSRRYNQLYADGEEDNEELVNQATIKDREWDAWKEENPRGSGNKMGKKY